MTAEATPAPSDADGSATERLVGVDTLRAVAMSAVILQHCKLFSAGWMGVWLFFVISGFVVTRSLLRSERSGSRRGAYGAFLARRGFRLWPVAFGFAALGFLVSGVVDGRWRWANLLAIVTATKNVFVILQGADWPSWPSNHLWSLSVEEQFYFFFGFVLLFLPRRGLPAVCLGLLVAAPVMRAATASALRAAGLDGEIAAFAIYASTPCQADSFALGALIALCEPKLRADRRLRRLLYAAAAMAAGAYIALQVGLNIRDGVSGGFAPFRNVISGVLFGHGREVWVYSILAAGAAALVVAVVGGDLPRRLFPAAAERLGRISYGAYVYHTVVVGVLRGAVMGADARRDPLTAGGLERLVFWAATMAVTVVVAEASYRLLETPMIRWGRELGRARRPGPAAASMRVRLRP